MTAHYYFNNQTLKETCKFAYSNPIPSELNKALLANPTWESAHHIVIECDYAFTQKSSPHYYFTNIDLKQYCRFDPTLPLGPELNRVIQEHTWDIRQKIMVEFDEEFIEYIKTDINYTFVS